ncbi:hypothetical protein QBC46DRAFT_379621 [Diplogelasinospora grovesii]|uniref:O-methyltransferase n=1 Tax=Diplogelasinospora grovesii TaxID=303347 RepID=A0AAN6NFB7_9PEZI|nr:hypothetical protein QBC46DRAFT_379621 [Diplogelasinospora grovesii]
MALASDPSAGSEKPWLSAISGASPRVLALLDNLHAQAAAEEPFVSADDPHNTAIDRFVGLEPDKCAFVYLLLRASGARYVVEAGTSFGLSTIYLALAVGQNTSSITSTSTSGPDEQARRGKVIATELEPSKAARAREHWKLAGPEVEPYIELREGDLRRTLAKDLPDQIDFLLLDSKPQPN